MAADVAGAIVGPQKPSAIPNSDSALEVLGVDDEDARRRDHDVVDVSLGARNPPVVQDIKAVDLGESTRELLLARGARSPRRAWTAARASRPGQRRRAGHPSEPLPRRPASLRAGAARGAQTLRRHRGRSPSAPLPPPPAKGTSHAAHALVRAYPHGDLALDQHGSATRARSGVLDDPVSHGWAGFTPGSRAEAARVPDAHGRCRRRPRLRGPPRPIPPWPVRWHARFEIRVKRSWVPLDGVPPADLDFSALVQMKAGIPSQQAQASLVGVRRFPRRRMTPRPSTRSTSNGSERAGVSSVLPGGMCDRIAASTLPAIHRPCRADTRP